VVRRGGGLPGMPIAGSEQVHRPPWGTRRGEGRDAAPGESLRAASLTPRVPRRNREPGVSRRQAPELAQHVIHLLERGRRESTSG